MDKNILSDDRFYIDEFIMERLFSNANSISYCIQRVKLKDIIMHIDGKFYLIQDTPAYKYLNGDSISKVKYREYCQMYGKKNPNRNENAYNSLIDGFYEYDIQKGAIIVNQYNILMDGQHRCCLLYQKYGGDYEIEVVKITGKIEWRILLSIIRFKLKRMIFR